jgi:predicted amidophosphoribosyltransferase
MKHRATSAQCRGCGAPIRVGLTWCNDCRRHVRREAAKRAARSRQRKVTLAKIGVRI